MCQPNKGSFGSPRNNLGLRFMIAYLLSLRVRLVWRMMFFPPGDDHCLLSYKRPVPLGVPAFSILCPFTFHPSVLHLVSFAGALNAS